MCQLLSLYNVSPLSQQRVLSFSAGSHEPLHFTNQPIVTKDGVRTDQFTFVKVLEYEEKRIFD